MRDRRFHYSTAAPIGGPPGGRCRTVGWAKRKRAHLQEHNKQGGYGARAPLPTLRHSSSEEPAKGVDYSTAAPIGGPPGGRCRKVMVRYAPIHEPSAAKAT